MAVEKDNTRVVYLYVGNGVLADANKYGYQDNVSPNLKFGNVNPSDWEKTGKYKRSYIWHLYGKDTEDISMGFGFVGADELAGVNGLDLTFNPPNECDTPISVSLAYDDTLDEYLGTNSSLVTLLKNNVGNVLEVIIDINYV